jgi:hypothetical protein
MFFFKNQKFLLNEKHKIEIIIFNYEEIDAQLSSKKTHKTKYIVK